MITPVKQVRGFRQPNVVAPQLGAARPVQGVILTSDLFAEQGTVFIMRRENHSLPVHIFPIPCLDQPYAHTIVRNHGVGEVEYSVYFGHPTIFNTVSFQFIFTEYRIVPQRCVKFCSIITAQQTEMR